MRVWGSSPGMSVVGVFAVSTGGLVRGESSYSVWSGAFVSVEVGFLFCGGLAVGTVEVSDTRNASRAAAPPFIVLMRVGPRGEGAY